jgi:NhaC family Na+:H+ antiporter
MEDTQKKVSFNVAVLNVSIVIVVVAVGNGYLRMPLDMMLIFTITAISLVVMVSNRYTPVEMLQTVVDGGKSAIFVSVLLMAIGAVIGSWIVSGIVPAIIYYGLVYISPAFFLVSGFLTLCALSFFTGSTYASSGTVGVALMSIGYGMGYPAALTGGMVVSGSVFGNKVSPFADTSNLAAATVGVELMDHVKSMCYTVLPVCFASAGIYTYLGMEFAKGALDASKTAAFADAMTANFTINPLLLLVPVFTVVLIMRKMSPIIVLLLATLAGIAIALFIQPYDIKEIIGAASSGFKIKSGIAQVDMLLNRGGISSMLSVVEIVILLLALAEVLQKTGTVERILAKVEGIVTGTKSLVAASLVSGASIDLATGSQYLSIILNGTMFKSLYEKFRVKPCVLSRCVEDSGMIFSYMVPWSTPAIVVGTFIGVPISDSLPYAYQCWLTPIIAMFYALTGIAVWRVPEAEVKEKAAVGGARTA